MREICQSIIANLTGRANVSEAEVVRLEKAVRRRAEVLRLQDPSLTEAASLQLAVSDITSRANAAALAKKRAALLNERKRLSASAGISANWGKQLGLGLQSMVAGTERNVTGARISAAGQQQATKALLLGGLDAGVSKLGKGTMRLFLADALDTDIARALWHLSREQPSAGELGKLHPEAVKIARVIRQQQELARTLLNREGASIGQYDGYIARQSHRVHRIARDEVGWKAMARQNFDIPRMMAEMDYPDVDTMIDSLYRALSTGLHLNLNEPPSATAAHGLGSLANKLSKSRVIHFKGPDQFLEYNRRFGAGSLRESIVHGLDRQARSIGLMQVLGTNPASFIDAMENDLAKTLRERRPDAIAATRFRSDINRARKLLRQVDGSLDVPGNSTLATYSSAARALQSVSLLGRALISSFNDIGILTVGARHNGVNIFQAADAAMRAVFHRRNKEETAEMASTLGVFFDSLSGRSAAGFSIEEGGPAWIGRGLETYFKLNFQTPWTDGFRMAGAEMLSHNLALNAAKPWEQLHPQLRKTLNLYSIDESAWNVVRRQVKKADDGRVFITTDQFEDNEPIQQALRAYFTDQNGYTVLTPDARSDFYTNAGLQRGTVAGEALAFVMQFKKFPISFTQKLIGRELVGNVDVDARGLSVLTQALQNGSAMAGIAHLSVLMTVFGYLSMSVKDLLDGRTPRDPTDPKTAMAAMQQGGGIGIMGDFLFARSSRAGSGLGATALGPAVTDVANVYDMYTTWRDSVIDPEKKAKLGDDLFRFTYSNAPGNNLFYLKPVMDYMFLWRVQEFMNPGSLRRTEARVKAAGQEYLISPSERVAEQRQGATR